MKLNYAYGQTSLLVKQAVRNSYYQWHGHKETTWQEQYNNARKKMKNCFIPNLYFSKDKPAQYTLFSSTKKETWKNIDATIKKLVISCYICYKNAKEVLKYTIEKPEVQKIKADIDTMVFAEVKTTDMKAYKEMFDKRYELIIEKCFETVEKNWNNSQLTKEIKSMFTTGYTYGVRKTANKWMNGLDEKELAKKFIEQGISELEQKHITAIKRLHKSVKKVKEEINHFMTDEECRKNIKKTVIKKNINEWFFEKLDNRQKNDILYYIKTLDKREMNIEMVKRLVFAYGYKPEWCSGSCFQWTPEMKPVYDEYLKTGYYMG